MKKKVLIVEDNNIDAELLYRLLSKTHKEEFAIAKTYDEAITALKNNKFRALIVDVNLHGGAYNDKNGFGVVSYARSVLGLNVPIIYYTGFPKEAYEGTDVYVQKPNFPRLLTEFNKLMYNE